MSAGDALSVIVSGSIVLALVGFIAACRPVLFLAFFFILFALTWRLASTMYIDLAGPIYSSQTERWIGPGVMTPVHALAYVLSLLPFLWFFQPKHIAPWARSADLKPSSEGAVTLSDLTYIASSLFLVWLFFDLTRIGVVPLLDHMERFDYTARHAGWAHRWLIEFGNLMCLWWGIMFAAEKIRNNRFDIRFLALMAVAFGYAFLTGNRFSIFYSFSSFFMMPIGAVIAIKMLARPAQTPFSWLRLIFRPQDLTVIGGLAVGLVLLVAAGLYNNLVNVRGYDQTKAFDDFIERSLVQPSELGWISFDRTFVHGHWQQGIAYTTLFEKPIDASRNTTPQYLMLQTIGEPRTSQHILKGFQFAGGFPEIFFELFGPVFAWPFLFGAAWLTAALLALFVRGVILGQYTSAFLSAYVLYGSFVMYIGGMLNFVTPWTYWVKLTALASALVLDQYLARRGSSLLPWVQLSSARMGELMSGASAALASLGGSIRRLPAQDPGKNLDGVRQDR